MGCLAVLSGCKDPVIDDNSLTRNPGDALNLNQTDTFTVYAFTVADAPNPSYRVAQGLLGSTNDPAFGKTYASVYGQVLLPNLNVRFPNATVDSVVLGVVYGGKYGKFSIPQDIAVYELSQYMDPTSTAYTTLDAFQVNGSPIGTVNGFIPNLTDSVVVKGVALAPQLRIRLNNNLGTRLLTADSLSYADNSYFLQYFKGFYLTTRTSVVGDGIALLNMHASGITVYYHTPTVADTAVVFAVTESSQTVNHIDHNFSGSPAQQAMNNTAVTGGQKLYIQSGGGTFGKLVLPFFDQNTLKNAAINRAELIFTLDDDPTYLDTLLTPPPGLLLYAYDSYNTPANLPIGPDQRINEGISTLTTRVENGKTVRRYTVPITTFVQRLANGTTPNYGLKIAYSFGQRTNRAVINHLPTDPNRIKLRVTYTKL